MSQAKGKWTLDFFLSALRDVFITSPQANDVLKYDGTNWINAPIASIPLFQQKLFTSDVTVPANHFLLLKDPDLNTYCLDIEGCVEVL